MPAIHLNHQEAELVSHLFQVALDELRVEVRHTDRLEYKEALKERERLLQGLIIKLHTEKTKEPAA
jgi:hypothetical protein